MHAFWLAVVRNLVVAALMAAVSALFRPKMDQAEAPKPQKSDFSPTADEGTEVKHLFGTGPVEMSIVAVMDKSVEAIIR